MHETSRESDRETERKIGRYERMEREREKENEPRRINTNETRPKKERPINIEDTFKRERSRYTG